MRRQVLYLEAEAYSLRGTGMGCFFDVMVHEPPGFSDNAYQDLCHFAVGKAVEDDRLTALPLASIWDTREPRNRGDELISGNLPRTLGKP